MKSVIVETICLVLILLLSNCLAYADSCGAIPMPPPQYDRPLVLAPIVHYMDFWRMDAWCNSIGVHQDGKGRIWACQRGREIWLPIVGTGGITLMDQQCLLRHESAHMWPNAWPWYHPDAIFI